MYANNDKTLQGFRCGPVGKLEALGPILAA